MTATLDTFTDALIDCENDPALFADYFLNTEESLLDDDGQPYFTDDDGNPTTFWKRQREMCESVAKYRTTVIYSGNAVGKDHWVGRLIWWWLYTHPGGLVIVTGPSQTLIGTVTWKEARRAIQNASIPFSARISQGAKTSPQQIDLGNGWQALGYSTTNVERSSGQHSGDLLVIVEEASGVEDYAWDAVESLGYDKLVVIGNPTRAEGVFVELIRQSDRDRADGVPDHLAVNAIQIPSTDSPHAELDKSPVGLADKTWLDSVKRRYGEKSLWYKSHVLAEIPAISSDILVPIQWFDHAVDESDKRPTVGPAHPVHLTRRLACDLGEGVGRDSSCVLVRDDWGVLQCEWGAQMGLPEAAQMMWSLGHKWSIPAARMSFDKLGIGKNFPNQLSRYNDHARTPLSQARPYAGSGRVANKAFTNLRTEAAWKLRERLDSDHIADIRSPHAAQRSFSFCPGTYQARLRTELIPLTYEFKGGATKLLGKDEWCEILGHSPDVADTLIQSFAFAAQ